MGLAPYGDKIASSGWGPLIEAMAQAGEGSLIGIIQETGLIPSGRIAVSTLTLLDLTEDQNRQ